MFNVGSMDSCPNGRVLWQGNLNIVDAGHQKNKCSKLERAGLLHAP